MFDDFELHRWPALGKDGAGCADCVLEFEDEAVLVDVVNLSDDVERVGVWMYGISLVWLRLLDRIVLAGGIRHRSVPLETNEYEQKSWRSLAIGKHNHRGRNGR